MESNYTIIFHFRKTFFDLFLSFFTLLVMSQTDLIRVLQILILPSNKTGSPQVIHTSLQMDEWALNLLLKFVMVCAEYKILN